MRFDNFADFDRHGDALFAQGKLDEVLNLFLRASEVLSREDYETEYFLIKSNIGSLYRRSGRMDEFFDVVKNLIESGYACGNWIINALLGMERDGVNELLEKNKLLLQSAQEKAKMKYQVHLPSDYRADQKYPVFFALHGDGADGNIRNFSQYWTPEAFERLGCITVYVQSSQVYCHGGFQWNIDVETARKDLLECFNLVSEEYSVDPSEMYIGGFSGGAMISVDFALGEVIPLKGFISLCPGSMSDYFSKDRTEAAMKRGVKGVILEGELDLEPSVQDLVKVFDESGFEYKYVINKGLGHVSPVDLTERLKEAMNFILRAQF